MRLTYHYYVIQTHFIHEEKREFQYTREEMLDDLDAAMGGRVAEELSFGCSKVSTGASSDMQHATQIAQNMVTVHGFSDKVGFMCLLFIASVSCF